MPLHARHVAAPMTTPGQRLDWHPAPARAASADTPPLWRDPARLMLVAGAAGLIVGSVIPWAVGTGPAGRPDSYRATQGTGEGMFMIAGAIVVLFLARNRLLWETSSRMLQLLPLLVAAISVVMWIGAEHFANERLTEWRTMGRGGELTVARYVVAGSIALIVAAFAWLEWRRPEEVRSKTRSLWAEWGLTRWSVASIGAAVMFGGLGAALGVMAGALLPEGEFILIALMLGVFGLFIGIGVGVVVVRKIEQISQRRD